MSSFTELCLFALWKYYTQPSPGPIHLSSGEASVNDLEKGFKSREGDPSVEELVDSLARNVISQALQLRLLWIGMWYYIWFCLYLLYQLVMHLQKCSSNDAQVH